MWIGYLHLTFAENANSFYLDKVSFYFYQTKLWHVHPETWFMATFSYNYLSKRYTKQIFQKSQVKNAKETPLKIVDEIELQKDDFDEKNNRLEDQLRMMEESRISDVN